MPNLLNRFKQEEFESNSAFRSKIKRKGGAEEEQKKSRKARASSHPCTKFLHHCAKFSLALLTFCYFYSHFPIFALHVYKCELRVFLYFFHESFI